MPRITDGDQVLLAAEYIPLVQQLGLTPNYDRLMVTQIIALSASWPQETLAMPVNVDSLLQRPFWRWLQEVLLQCPKQQRQRILFELAESDVCQHIERLRPILNTLVGLGCRLAVTQAGLTLSAGPILERCSWKSSSCIQVWCAVSNAGRKINFLYKA